MKSEQNIIIKSEREYKIKIFNKLRSIKQNI